MNPLTAAEIRHKFIQFFEGKDHKHLPSSPLIPYNDPTVLLTTAGMLQFKGIMFGTEQAAYPRATTYQKCFRTTEWIPSAPIRASPRTVATVAPLRRSMNSAVTPFASCSNDPSACPASTFATPRRSRTASSSVICNSPRWIEYCGHRYPAAFPRGSDQIRWPCFV